jgi:tetratricopeptide (TPR) repeat protein
MKKTMLEFFALVLLLAAWSTGFCTSQSLARGHFDNATAQPAESNLKQGLQLMRQSNYEAAIDSFTQAVYFSRNHYNPEAYKLLGLSYKATRQYGKAVEALNNHLKQTTEPAPDAHIDLAECYINLSEWSKARDALQTATVEDSADRTNYRQKYMTGFLQERMEEVGACDSIGNALTFYDMAVALKPTYTKAWMGKGRAEVKLKRYNEALKTYRTMLEKGPLLQGIDYEELYCNMSYCLLQRGDHQGALDHWRLALEYNPDSFSAHLGLAQLFDGEKHLSSAAKEYEAALRCVPERNQQQKDKIMRRMQWIEQQMTPKQAPAEIKPSPSMRKEFEESVNRDNLNTAPLSGKDSGF